MIRLEEWVDIVSRRAAGQSIKGIARDLGVSRNTVRATLRREGPPRYERRPSPSKLDAHRDYLIARLAEFPELSAKQLLAEVRARGYEGGISILKDFTRPYRVSRRGPVVRFETPPGQQAQCDFGELGHLLLAHRRLEGEVEVLERLACGDCLLYTSPSPRD